MASRPTCSHEQLERELRLVLDECNFQLLEDYTSLAASASLLSSVIAFQLGSPVGLYYLRKQNCVKAGILPRLRRQDETRGSVNPQL